MNDQVASIYSVKNTLIDLAIRFGPKLLIAIIILLAGVAASRWVSRWMLRMLHRLGPTPPRAKRLSCSPRRLPSRAIS